MPTKTRGPDQPCAQPQKPAVQAARAGDWPIQAARFLPWKFQCTLQSPLSRDAIGVPPSQGSPVAVRNVRSSMTAWFHTVTGKNHGLPALTPQKEAVRILGSAFPPM